MASFNEITLGQNGNRINAMDDDMMTEYYNTDIQSSSNFPDDQAMMMMEEAENVVFNPQTNDEIMMEEYGEVEDGKVQENINPSFASVSNYSQPLDSHTFVDQIEHIDENIGEMVYGEGEGSDQIYQSTNIEEPKADIATGSSKEDTSQSQENTLEVVNPETFSHPIDPTPHEEGTDVQQIVEEKQENGVDSAEHNEVVNEEKVEGNDQKATIAEAHESTISKEVQESDQIVKAPADNEAEENARTVAFETHVDQGEGSNSHSSPNPSPIRLTFNDQDFVLFSKKEPASFISISSDQREEEEIQAPILSIDDKVFFEPLESFFESLRIREALGDFLDDGTELCLTFPELTMITREDDIYVREVTLDDIQRLYTGLGHHSSMHIKVSEGNRFITRYNELATHVSNLIEQKSEAEISKISTSKEELTAPTIVTEESSIYNNTASNEEETKDQNNSQIYTDVGKVEEQGGGGKGEEEEEEGGEEEEEEKEDDVEDDEEEEETFVTVDGDQKENAGQTHWQSNEEVAVAASKNEDGTKNDEDYAEEYEEKTTHANDHIEEAGQTTTSSTIQTSPANVEAQSLHATEDVSTSHDDNALQTKEEEEKVETEEEDEEYEVEEEHDDGNTNEYGEEIEHEGNEEDQYTLEDEEEPTESYDDFAEEDHEIYEETNESYDAEEEEEVPYQTTSSIGLKRHHEEDEEQYTEPGVGFAEDTYLGETDVDTNAQEATEAKRVRYETFEQGEE